MTIARATFLALLGLFALPVRVQGKVSVAPCGPEGCRCALSSLTAEETGVVEGRLAPAGTHTPVLVEVNGEWSEWTLQEIDFAARRGWRMSARTLRCHAARGRAMAGAYL